MLIGWSIILPGNLSGFTAITKQLHILNCIVDTDVCARGEKQEDQV